MFWTFRKFTHGSTGRSQPPDPRPGHRWSAGMASIPWPSWVRPFLFVCHFPDLFLSSRISSWFLWPFAADYLGLSVHGYLDALLYYGLWFTRYKIYAEGRRSSTFLRWTVGILAVFVSAATIPELDMAVDRWASRALLAWWNYHQRLDRWRWRLGSSFCIRPPCTAILMSVLGCTTLTSLCVQRHVGYQECTWSRFQKGYHVPLQPWSQCLCSGHRRYLPSSVSLFSWVTDIYKVVAIHLASLLIYQLSSRYRRCLSLGCMLSGLWVSMGANIVMGLVNPILLTNVSANVGCGGSYAFCWWVYQCLRYHRWFWCNRLVWPSSSPSFAKSRAARRCLVEAAIGPTLFNINGANHLWVCRLSAQPNLGIPFHVGSNRSIRFLGLAVDSGLSC